MLLTVAEREDGTAFFTNKGRRDSTNLTSYCTVLECRIRL
jgi:hypothetical protein